MADHEVWFTEEQVEDHIKNFGNGLGKLRSTYKTGDSNPNAPKVSLEAAKKRLAARKQRQAAKLESAQNDKDLESSNDGA